nr:transposase [Candidatus Absconditicoccus praedator]
MGNKRNKYSSKFKLQVITELIHGHKTQSQITSEYGVHPNQQNRWKQQFIENAESIFDDKREKNNKDKENEKLIEHLYSKLGKVTMEKEWLEKKIGELPNIFGKN